MFRMGCAKADTTPGFPVYQRGYASRNKLAVKIEDPIEAGVIVLEQDGKKILILTVDHIGIEYQYCRKIAQAIAPVAGIAEEDIFINSSHTHFAPGFNGYTIYFPDGELKPGRYEEDSTYFEFWMDKVLAAVKHAVSDLEEVTLLQADIPVTSVSFNRRTVRKSDGGVDTNYTYPLQADKYNFSPVDPTLNVWKFMRGNTPKAVLARFSCHPVTGGYDLYAVSADYPGYFKRAVLEKLHCPGFFMQGAVGDSVPMLRNGKSRQDIGEILASSIRLAERTFRETSNFTLKSATVMLPLTAPAAEGKSNADLEKLWAEAMEKNIKQQEYSEDIYMQNMLCKTLLAYGDEKREMPIKLIRLGDITLVGLPFEALTIIGKKIQEKFPDAVICSCTNGYGCYLPLAEDFPKGGYEPLRGTVWAPETGDEVVKLTVKALAEM